MAQKPSNETILKQFHEARKRASQPQPVVKYKTPKSLLLPAPNNIIFELFNTVVKEVSADKLLEFITAQLKAYLAANWSAKVTQQAIKRLKREQTIDVRAGLVSAPVIKFSTGVLTARPVTTIIDTKPKQPQTPPPPPQSPPPAKSPTSPQSPTKAKNQQDGKAAASPPITKQGSSGSRGSRGSRGSSGVGVQRSPPIDYKLASSKQKAIDQIYEHVMWRIKTDNVTQITSLLIKLVLDDGYKKGTLTVESYDDILECFTDWRSQKLIKLYSFGTAPANDQKLVLSSTTSGNLTKWIANYIDGTEKRQKPDLIRVLATALRDKTKNCIYITHELIDAIKSLETGALRCVFLVDRLNRHEPITSMPKMTTDVEPLITSGKLFVMSTLRCVEFAPDPANDTCC